MDLWDRVQDRLRDLVPGRSFDTWIRPMSLLAVDGGELGLGVPHPFYKDWVDEHFRTLIETCAETELGFKVKVGFTIQQQTAEPARHPEPASVRPRLRHVTGLNHRHTFETFVVGPSSQFARAASRAVAERQEGLTPALHLRQRGRSRLILRHRRVLTESPIRAA
jgi:chromosomal replication initiator protein